MATLTASGAGRGRRKQAKPQRKVDADPGPVPEDPPNPSLLGKSPGHRAIVMSPDDNHNEIAETSNDLQKIKHGPIHKEGDVPEEVPEASRLGVIKHVKSGGRPEDLDGDSDKAAIGGDTSEDDDKIIEYMRRSDTAVIFPEQVETHQTSNVPGALNGLKPEPEELSPGQEYFMKCPQCQKGYQTYQGLKDHIESAHGDMLSMENGSVSSNPLSPTTNLSGSGGPYACSQCSASFANKDQLEKHELLHSPNPQVFCKVCNKTFANVYRLQRHMISHDESAVLRKFKCTECDKAFKFKHHLKEHIRIHSGEKPFECGNCGKRFSHSGSYSSHMTSKKCLVMNLKLGRTRAPNTTNLEKSSPSPRGPKRNSLNNNLATSPNQNGMFPILPKYTDAATAAALFNPFYISPPNMPIPPYSIPTIGEFLEKLQRVSPQTSGVNIMENDERKNVEESDGELDKTKSSSCGDLVMDEEEIEVKDEEEEKNNGDLEAVKRILETVNVSVTKQFLQANMQKYSDTSDCNSVASAQSPQAIFNCNSCRKTFPTQNSLEEHECDSSEVKSEGLAAKLEDALTTKSENDAQNGSFSGNSDEEYDKHHNDEEIDNERVATTDQLSDDGRKVRVRSLISDEQLKVLKDNYAINPRPKREDLTRIAEQIGFPVRVVQVWFQNTRARDRREGRLIQIPYNQPRFPVSQTSQYFPQPTSYSSEQPLDLSIRKDTSRDSSPWSSPRPTSIHHSDSEDVVNLSHKSSRSPTPFQHSSYQNYQNSNCSSELRRSPSPIDFKNGQSRLAQILAQPSHKLPLPGMSLVPMDRLMQFGNQELQNFSQMITNLSPSNKRSWSDDGDATQESADDEMNSKRKVGQLVMKSLGSPMLGNQEEAEGQFGCDQCDKSFSKQSSLARHKYEHSGQRPHKCDECPKAFKHKHHLTEHKRLHSGEKPFQCQKCLKRFSHSGSYSQHMNHRYSYCKPYRE